MTEDHSSPANAGLTVEELATKIESFEATSLLDRSEIRMIVKALRSFHHAQQMPIAWRWRHSSSYGIWTYGEEKPDGPSIGLFEVVPLYASSSPESQSLAEDAIKRQQGIKPDVDALAHDLVAAGEQDAIQPLSSPDRWTEQDIAEAKAEAKELHDYFHPIQTHPSPESQS